MNGQATLHFSHTKVESPSIEQRRSSSKVLCAVVSVLCIVLVGVKASGTKTASSHFGQDIDAFETDMGGITVTSHALDVRRRSHCVAEVIAHSNDNSMRTRICHAGNTMI